MYHSVTREWSASAAAGHGGQPVCSDLCILRSQGASQPFLGCSHGLCTHSRKLHPAVAGKPRSTTTPPNPARATLAVTVVKGKSSRENNHTKQASQFDRIGPFLTGKCVGVQMKLLQAAGSSQRLRDVPCTSSTARSTLETWRQQNSAWTARVIGCNR